MIKTIPYFCIVVLTVSGCVSGRHVSRLQKAHDGGTSFTSGTFHNTTEKEENVYPETTTLIDHLSRKFITNDSLADVWKDYDIKFVRDSLSNKRLFMYISSGDTLIDTRTIKGKWKDNNFHVRRLVRPIGVPLIYFWYYENKIILSWSENDLYIHKGECKMGMILIISGGMNDYTTSCYEKK